MAILTVERINPQALLACRVSAATPEDIVALSAALKPAGWVLLTNLTIGRITITSPGGVDQHADVGDWILVTDATATYTSGQLTQLVTSTDSEVMVYSAAYPAQSGNPVTFVNLFTANVPTVWAATNDTTHPVAQARGNGTASLTFGQPTSADGPWTYTVAQTNIHTEATEQVTISPAVDSDGNVTLTIPGLVVGDGYTFTAALTNKYGVTTTAAASNQITAT